MSGLIKNMLKPSYLRSAATFFSSKLSLNAPANQPLRNMWSLSSFHNRNEIISRKNDVGCTCGCQVMTIHTKGEKELAEFLTEEITAEKALQGTKLPNEVNGFQVKVNGPEVTLVKNLGDETVTVKFNVNHSVGEETEYDASESGPTSKEDAKTIINRPPFDVEINRGGRILGFRCSMVAPPPKESTSPDDPYNDLFTIDEIVMCDGEWKDADYHVPGEIMDGTLYDLLMNMLEDKGIGNELVEKVTAFSTDYEHSLYVNLLEKMQSFVTPAK
ncbi:complement C1q binding protein P32 isoform X2 [Rhodnius prolixus]|uniref:complement C1q binding protein P32 isoform X2 n=1 Tax=Rhodnius prolixus TaxID=13249 RepID=UPI003D18992D